MTVIDDDDKEEKKEKLDKHVAINKRIAELEQILKDVVGMECEVYARVCGFMTPIKQWNLGKIEEYNDREKFNVKEVMKG